MDLPERIEDTEQLDELLSRPTPGLLEDMQRLEGDLMVLGAGGKMGPTLTRMARRAFKQLGRTDRVIAVSRFSSTEAREMLEQHGVETIPCDLLDASAVAELPEARNLVYMAGMKFGASGNQPLTWAMNALLPAMVCRRFARSRIAAFSTGNVYGLTPVDHGGSVEGDPPDPVGEYAMSCLGRERMFEYFAKATGVKVCLIRLNYAVEMRYGVLVDIARKVWQGEPVDAAMGYANVIWQGDANAMALRCLLQAQSPATAINITGPEILSVRRLTENFANLLDRQAEIVGIEAEQALLANATRSHQLFGKPHVSVDQMMRWIADWTERDRQVLGKPTKFEVRDGKF